MLNIPADVKALFKQDGIKKNFRVHFPNGERADITNSNLIKESVSFSESLCSQDKFKLGLCESPYIKFETFGVGNIKGAKIECSLEIDCESLGTQTSGGTIYPEYVEHFTDTGMHAYSIPYGVFFVDSCERTADMERRKVIAYGEQAKMNWNANPTFIPSLEAYSWNASQNISFTFEEICDLISPAFACKRHQDELVYAGELSDIISLRDPMSATRGSLTIYSTGFKFNTYNLEEASGYIKDIITAKIIPNMQYINELEEIKERIWRSTRGWGADYEVLMNLLDPRVSYSFIKNYGENTSNYLINTMRGWVSSLPLPSRYNKYDEINGIEYIRKETERSFLLLTNGTSGSSTKYVDITFEIKLPYKIELKIGGDTRYVDEYNRGSVKYLKQPLSEAENSFYRLTSQPETVNVWRVPKSNPNLGQMISRTDYKFKTPDDLQKVLEAYTEINGKLGRFERTGGFELFTISNNFGLYPSETLYPDLDLYPRESNGGVINRSQYKSAWYEDDFTKPYGRVCVTYKDSTTHGDAFAYLDIAEDYAENSDQYQLYSISYNYIIDNFEFSDEQIMVFLNNIAETLKNVRYMPASLSMQALPYMETGDVISVITKDSGFETMVLDRTISGIQSLTDNITAR